MPVYINNNIDEYISKTTNTNPKQPSVRFMANTEKVNLRLGSEPGKIAVPQMNGEQLLYDGNAKDISRGRGLEGMA